MKTKALFLILFVPLHSFLTLLALQRMFNPAPGGLSSLFKVGFALLTSPIVLPLLMFGPDEDRLPKWFQPLAVPLNSLVWGLGLLILIGTVKRYRRRKNVLPMT